MCKPKKSLYGLKQSPRQWYKKFESFMENYGYGKTISDHCVFKQDIDSDDVDDSDQCTFTKRFENDEFIILLLYVDDMLIIGQHMKKINKLKSELSRSFAMKDLGQAKQILGMEIKRERKAKKLWLS